MIQADYWPDPFVEAEWSPDHGYGYEFEPWPEEVLDETFYDGDYQFAPARPGPFRLDGISLVAVALVMLVAFWLVTGKTGLLEAAAGSQSPPATGDGAESLASPPAEAPDMDQVAINGSSYQSVAAAPADDTVVAPYDDYILTQGPHGYAYGHMAIDISAGEGAEIKSPIQGTVTAFYYDAVGNPSLVVENSRYQVLLLHGLFTAEVGQSVALGQVIGTESNQGNTLDMAGNSCRNRDCGYHTHLNIYDKTYGVNVNPLELLP